MFVIRFGLRSIVALETLVKKGYSLKYNAAFGSTTATVILHYGPTLSGLACRTAGARQQNVVGHFVRASGGQTVNFKEAGQAWLGMHGLGRANFLRKELRELA